MVGRSLSLSQRLSGARCKHKKGVIGIQEPLAAEIPPKVVYLLSKDLWEPPGPHLLIFCNDLRANTPWRPNLAPHPALPTTTMTKHPPRAQSC